MNINEVNKTNYNERNNAVTTSSGDCLAIPEILEKIFMQLGRPSDMGNLARVSKNINQTAKLLQDTENSPNRYQTVLLQIFASLFREPTAKITSCFISLSEKNKIFELRALINSQKFNELSSGAFSEIFKASMEGDRGQIVKALINSQKFSEVNLSLGEILKNSAKEGYIEVVKELIGFSRFEEINGRDLGEALYQATLNRHEELAIELLNVCHSKENIPADPVNYIGNDWGEAFKYAAQNGLEKFINQFIAFDAPFGKIILNQLRAALILASGDGHLKIVEAIIASSRFHEITQSDLNTAYQRASLGKHAGLVQILESLVEGMHSSSN